MNKKGLEIGVNFLVILILVIVIFGFGFMIFARLFERTEGFQNSVDEGTQKQIDALLDSGEPVSVPRSTATVDTNDPVIFHIGINNEFENDETFHVVIDHAGVGPPPGGIFEINYDTASFTLSPGGRKYMPFQVIAPGSTLKGTYILDVGVCYAAPPGPDETPCSSGEKRYYLLNKIYLNVR